jgi:hypothetical protein
MISEILHSTLHKHKINIKSSAEAILTVVNVYEKTPIVE